VCSSDLRALQVLDLPDLTIQAIPNRSEAEDLQEVQWGVETGTFEIDPGRTADKLIEFEFALNGKG
jgi:hypothetical protein